MIKFLALALGCCLWSGPSVAATPDDPEMMTLLFTERLSKVLNLLETQDAENASEINREVIAKTADLFDFNRMTALAVGYPWRDADLAQKSALAHEIKYKLIHSYLSLWPGAGTVDLTINQHPLIKNPREFVIQTKIVRPSGQNDKPVSVDYFFYQTNEGYKIYNISVQGVSLVTAFRGEFSEIIRARGIDGLIAALQEENQRVEAGEKPPARMPLATKPGPQLTHPEPSAEEKEYSAAKFKFMSKLKFLVCPAASMATENSVDANPSSELLWSLLLFAAGSEVFLPGESFLLDFACGSETTPWASAH